MNTVEPTNQPVVGHHIQVGYSPSETEQALVQRVHELERKLAEFESWVKAANQFAWAHEKSCPGYFFGGAQCICGLNQFLGRPRPFVESYKSQLEEARRKIANLEGDKKALQMALESNTRECNHWALQYAQERAAKEAAELNLEAAAIVFREQRANR